MIKIKLLIASEHLEQPGLIQFLHIESVESR